MKVPGLIQEFRFDNSVTLCIVLMPRVFVALFALSLISLPVTHASEPLSQDTRMKLVKTLSGNLSPKSVLSSGTGLVSAHNMMYNHTVTIFDAETIAGKFTGYSESWRKDSFPAEKITTLMEFVRNTEENSK